MRRISAAAAAGSGFSEAEPARPPELPRRRGSISVPLVTFSVILVVLVLAVVAVVSTRGRGSTRAGIDSCVVGTWTVTTMKMDILTDEFGVIHFTSVGEAGRIQFSMDGKGITDYGDSTEFLSEFTSGSETKKVSLKVSGIARYDFTTTNSTLTFSNVRNEGKTTLTVVATGASSATDLEISSQPARYSCQSDIMTTFTEDYRSESRRYRS